MIADWSVEAGAESPCIVVPWPDWTDLRGSSEGSTRFAECIAETRLYPELAPLLQIANSGGTFTTKVDVFPVTREDADPEIAEAGVEATAHGLGSYLDLLTMRLDVFNAFAVYEEVTRNAALRLHKRQQELCAVEIVLRPARFYDNDTFGWSLYAMGFGRDESQARNRWAETFRIALDALQESIAAWITVPVKPGPDHSAQN